MVLDMSNSINFQDYPCEPLANSQLRLVLAQAQFPPVTRLDERVQDLRESLRRSFPLFSEERVHNIVISDAQATTTEGNKVFRFSSIDRTWSAVVTEGSVALETRKYEGIADFSARADEVWRTINRIVDPQYQVRLGFRFINEFRYEGGSEYSTWRRLLNPGLLGFDAEEAIGGSVRQSVSEVILDRKDGQLIMRRGFLRGTTVPPLPGNAPPTDAFFLLDLDYVHAEPMGFNSAPSQMLTTDNSLLYRIFRWAIDDRGELELYHFLKGDA
jgi:uncharacterized protein (TIGR04255 family)